jgi:protein-tyrosine phosphatase
VGKQAPGSLPFWSLIVHLPYFVLTHSLWHLQRILGREDPANEVAPCIWVGRRPYPNELPPACKLVVDLTCEFTGHSGVAGVTEYLAFPTLDATAPSPETLEAIARMSNLQGTILFNCASGHGRSATCAAALMLARGIVPNVMEAEAMMKAVRPGIGLNGAQRACLEAHLRAKATPQ